jgi:hypothetical protein
VSWPWIVLLALAVALVVAAEWERVGGVVGSEGRRSRTRRRRKAKLTLVRPESEEDDDFAASVQRDLEQLPTIEEHDRRRP